MQSFEERARHSVGSDHQKELVKLLHSFSGRHSHWKVFTDFCEIAAITFSNAVDQAQRERREDRYLQIVKGYNRAELDLFAQGFAHLTLAMETKTGDVLGRTYHDLELHNKWAGQYFTPYDVAPLPPRVPQNTDELKRAFILLGNRINDELNVRAKMELEGLLGVYPTAREARGWKRALQQMAKTPTLDPKVKQ